MIDLMPESLPIFVGSTFADLEPHRTAVLYALQRLEAVVRGMEHFGSLPGTPKDECLRKVRSCRAYIGIFAMRYGTTDQEAGKSITELEYEEAQRFHLRPLIYLIDEERQPVLPKHVDFGESAEKLKALKDLLKKHHVVSFFTTPDDLAMRVTQDVARLIQEGGLSVQEAALARVVENLPRVDWLTEERFAFLKKDRKRCGAGRLRRSPPGSIGIYPERRQSLCSIPHHKNYPPECTRSDPSLNGDHQKARHRDCERLQGYGERRTRLTAVRTGVSGIRFQAFPPAISRPSTVRARRDPHNRTTFRPRQRNSPKLTPR